MGFNTTFREFVNLCRVDFEQRMRVRAGVTSLVVGSTIMAAKFVAYARTGSAAVLSDALESIANVAAAGFLVGSVAFAGKPADRDHPYGHGKIEFFAAAFEGGLITFAAIATVVAAIESMVTGPTVRAVEEGLWITGGAAVANWVLGRYLLRVGRRSGSVAIEADGHHVLSDVWSTVAVLLGLGAVRVTGNAWLDPVIALAIGGILGITGLKLVRTAAGGLLDEADEGVIEKILSVLERERPRSLIRLHHLRALRFGARTHVDAHLVVPEFWSVERAHNLCDGIEQKLKQQFGSAVDVVFHADPCHRSYCKGCEVEDCAVRVEAFTGRPPLTLDEARTPDAMPGQHA